MRWLAFGFATYLLLGAELGLVEFLRIGDDLAPSFLLVFATYIALSAQPGPALLAATVIGALMDLTQPWAAGTEMTVLLGPNALGYAAGAWLVVNLRGHVFRYHPAATAVLTFAMGLAVIIVGHFLIATRFVAHSLLNVYEPMEWWTPVSLLRTDFLTLLYSCLLAVPMIWVLNRFTPVFGLSQGHRLSPY